VGKAYALWPKTTADGQHRGQRFRRRISVGTYNTGSRQRKTLLSAITTRRGDTMDVKEQPKPAPRYRRLADKPAPVFDFLVYLAAALFVFLAMAPLLFLYKWTDIMSN